MHAHVCVYATAYCNLCPNSERREQKKKLRMNVDRQLNARGDMAAIGPSIDEDTRRHKLSYHSQFMKKVVECY